MASPRGGRSDAGAVRCATRSFSCRVVVLCSVSVGDVVPLAMYCRVTGPLWIAAIEAAILVVLTVVSLVATSHTLPYLHAAGKVSAETLSRPTVALGCAGPLLWFRRATGGAARRWRRSHAAVVCLFMLSMAFVWRSTLPTVAGPAA